jgi:hypothetical protein
MRPHLYEEGSSNVDDFDVDQVVRAESDKVDQYRSKPLRPDYFKPSDDRFARPNAGRKA